MADEESGFPRRVAAAFYFFLILLGIAFYVTWSLLYNTWDLTKRENTGVYAMTIILVGAGITGFLLYRTKPKKAEQPETPQ